MVRSIKYRKQGVHLVPATLQIAEDSSNVTAANILQSISTLDAPMHKLLLGVVSDLIAALERGEDAKADSLLWVGEVVWLLVNLEADSARGDASAAERLFADVTMLFNATDATYGALDEPIIEMLESKSEVGDLLRERVSREPQWHSMAHRLLDHSSLCQHYKENRRDVVLGDYGDEVSKVLEGINLVRVGESWVPEQLAHFTFTYESAVTGSTESNFEESDALESLLPLNQENAYMLAKLNLARLLLEPMPCEDDTLFWVWEVFQGFSWLGTTETSASDCMELLRASLDVFDGYPMQIGNLAAGFIEDVLRKREDVWESLAQLARSDARFKYALGGVWADAETAARMPKELAESVIVLGRIADSSEKKKRTKGKKTTKRVARGKQGKRR